MTSSYMCQDILEDGGTNMKAYFVGTIEDLGDSGIDRVPGFFATQEEAIDAVENNRHDIHEDCYTYAVIECLESGLYPEDLDPLFYKWIDGMYQRIKRPAEWQDLYGFTLG